MKKTFISIFFGFLYSIFSSLVFVCLVELSGIFFSATVFEISIIKDYPRLIPFCIIVGALSFVLLVIAVVCEILLLKKIKFSGVQLLAQVAVVTVCQIPTFYIWYTVMIFLQKLF